jgi:hypothetical protein
MDTVHRSTQVTKFKTIHSSSNKFHAIPLVVEIYRNENLQKKLRRLASTC